nr:MAG TPA: hypothetical protein [Caudoviricetes sp.]
MFPRVHNLRLRRKAQRFLTGKTNKSPYNNLINQLVSYIYL